MGKEIELQGGGGEGGGGGDREERKENFRGRKDTEMRGPPGES